MTVTVRAIPIAGEYKEQAHRPQQATHQPIIIGPLAKMMKDTAADAMTEEEIDRLAQPIHAASIVRDFNTDQ